MNEYVNGRSKGERIEEIGSNERRKGGRKQGKDVGMNWRKGRSREGWKDERDKERIENDQIN